jgi:hypothetical protein
VLGVVCLFMAGCCWLFGLLVQALVRLVQIGTCLKASVPIRIMVYPSTDWCKYLSVPIRTSFSTLLQIGVSHQFAPFAPPAIATMPMHSCTFPASTSCFSSR